MGSILFRNRIRCREKSLSKRCIIRVENRYLPGNCDPPPTPSHSDDRMTGIRHSSEPGRLLVNIFLLFFFSLFLPYFPFFCSLLRYTSRLGSRECGATISRTRHYACQKQQYRGYECARFLGDTVIRRK